jgi:thiol-disulfide isomerase/thioredoxin
LQWFVGWGSRGCLVHVALALFDFVYRGLCRCPARFRDLVSPGSEEANRMKPIGCFFTRLTRVLLVILLGLLLAWAAFNRFGSRPLAVHLLLSSNNPREEFFDELVKGSNDPVDLLNRCWATGKIAHRKLVAGFLKDNARIQAPWFVRAEPLLLAGASDADVSVRELALAALEVRQSPRFFECAKAQLADLDPSVRLLGLEHLKSADPVRAVPVVIRLLDDPDLRVAARAEVALMRWSGEDFGVRMRLAVVSQQGIHAGAIEPADAEAIRSGVKRRKQWWQLHSKEYPATPGNTADAALVESARLPNPSFTLKDLDGKAFSLADWRGKVVFINFWATWCPSCLAEIPQLVALQNKLGREVVIVGVALDGVPDEDGDTPKQDGEESDPRAQSPKSIRGKVARAVKARGINYTVLLDPTGAVGGQFNGGELPTTVIFDKEGRVRRRFIGERDLKTFEAMLADASGAHP